MSQTGTKIIQILGIVAFLVLALSMLMNWRTHKELRNFHEEKFAFLQNELKSGISRLLSIDTRTDPSGSTSST